jgi:hypothetical protein
MPIHAPFASVPVSPISGPGITEVQVSGEFEVRRKCLFLSSTSDLLKTVTYTLPSVHHGRSLNPGDTLWASGRDEDDCIHGLDG